MDTALHPKNFIQRIATSRFFVIALIIHAIFVALFGGKVLFNKYVEKPEFKADEGVFLKDTKEEAPPAPPAPPAPQLAPSVPTMPTMSAITVNTPTMTDFTLPASPITPPSISNTLADQAPISAPMQGLGTLPGTMQGRTADHRAAAMSEKGGKPASELAVLNALRWLQKVQNPDGTWGDKYKGAMTGLALLCYQGHGETHLSSKEFGIVISNAINAELASGAKNQGVLTFRGNIIDQPGSYEQGIGTYALGEAYTMTKDDHIAPVLTQAIGLIINGQGADGGWVYGFAKTIPSDTSVTGWQIQALKAAHLTGLPIDGVPAALDNAMKDLDRVYNPKNGSYGYRAAGDHTYTLTGVGVLSKIFWQGRLDAKIRESMKDIMAGPDVDYNGEKANLYAWYYNTQACFMVGGSAWEKWNRMFQDQLISHQSPDGSWPATGGKDVGNLNADDTIDGALYRTCLCTLMLEVYYRYLPTGKEGAVGGGSMDAPHP